MSEHKYIDKKWKNGKWVYTYKDNKKENKEKKDYKYIKREWKNGKWVYTYPEDLEGEEKKKFGLDDEEDSKEDKKEKFKKESTSFVSKLLDSGKKFVESKKDIMNKPVSKLDSVISKGTEKVQTWLSNQKKKSIQREYKKEAHKKVKQDIERVQREKMIGRTWRKDPLPKIPHKTKETPYWEDMKIVTNNQKKYKDMRMGNSENCAVAYDLRRAGYDVKALPKDSWATLDDLAHLYYDRGKNIKRSEDVYQRWTGRKYNKETTSIRTQIEYVVKDMEKYPNGARGIMAIYKPEGGMRIVNWEKDHGAVKYRDVMNNERGQLMNLPKDFEMGRVAYFRTDDTDPKENVQDYITWNKKKTRTTKIPM